MNFRFYQNDDEFQILPLLEEVFEGWPKFDLPCSAMDHWKWKHDSYNKSKIVVAETENKIIGCIHDIVNNIKIGENIIQGVQGTDAAVHSEYRRMGVYGNMNKVWGDLILSYAVSGNPIVIKNSLSKGAHRFPYPILNMIKIFNIDKHFEQSESRTDFIKKYGFKTIEGINRLFKSDNNIEKTHECYEIEEINHFTQEANDFWDEIKHYYNFIIERNKEYLNWRYCDPRGGQYFAYQIKTADKLIGYMILRVNNINSEYPIGNIVDFLTLPSNYDSVNTAVEFAHNIFNDLGVNCLHYWGVKGHPITTRMGHQGYIEVPNSIACWFSSLSQYDTSFLNNLRSDTMYFCRGDTDWI